MGGSSGNVYAPSNSSLSGANSNLTNLLGQNYSALQNYTPSVTNTATSLTNSYLNNPYAPYAQSGANTTSAYGTGSVAPAQAGAASSLFNQVSPYSNAAVGQLSSLYNPQNSLYNYNVGQVMDQSNAINAMNGVSGSPYGANLTDQALQQFNQNWATQLAQLQSQNAQTANTLTGAGVNAANTGSNLAGTALNTLNTAYQLPSSTYTTNLANDLAALSGQNTAVGGASDIINNLASGYQNYLSYGTNAGAQQAQAQQSALSGLGSLFGSLLGLGTGSNNSTLGGSAVNSLFGTNLSGGLGSIASDFLDLA